MAQELKKCAVCGADMATGAKSCPQCGAQNKKPIYKKGWFIAIVIVVLLAIGIGSMGGGESSTSAQSGQTQQSQQTQEPSKPAEKFTFVEGPTEVRDSYMYKIVGILKNNTDREISYGQVEFVVFDKSGNQLTTAYANITNWAAGGTWKFEAVTLEEPQDVGSFQFKEVTGF